MINEPPTSQIEALPPSEVAKPLFDLQQELKQLLDGISENSKHARNVLFSLVVVSAYAMITAFSVSQENTTIKLPIIDVNIAVAHFFFVSPLLILGIFLYLNIYIDELVLRLDRFDELISNSSIKVERPALLLYPWILIFARYGAPRARLIAALSFRWFPIIVLFALWAKFVLKENIVSLVLLLCLIIAIFANIGNAKRRGLWKIGLGILSFCLSVVTVVSVPALRPSWLVSLWNAWKSYQLFASGGIYLISVGYIVILNVKERILDWRALKAKKSIVLREKNETQLP